MAKARIERGYEFGVAKSHERIERPANDFAKVRARQCLLGVQDANVRLENTGVRISQRLQLQAGRPPNYPPYRSCRDLLPPGRRKELPDCESEKPFELTPSRSVLEFALAGREALLSALKKFGPRLFRIHTDMGTMIILRPEHGEEIRNDARFSVDVPIIELFHAEYPGFEPFMEGALPSKPLQNVVKLRITKSLAKVTKPLAEECASTLRASIGEPDGDEIKRVISKMSARIFVGPNLSKNERWVELVVNYGNSSIEGMRRLRLWPRLLKPLAVHLIPECRNLQAQVKEAWDFVSAEIQARHAKGDGAEYDDAIYWFEELAAGNRYNFGASQLMLAVVAIGTTADLITQALVDILRHPELIQPLRQEIIAAVSEGDWKKTSLHNMKLLDSVLNESQRLKPNQIYKS
ncbi:trichothecene c-8 hydroxylase cytochrome p450 monooxygenase [Colletotrichum plurivorum]|uniref:Trichothecene c-8 hydroxylase cytochrome p450 monooxygenase n=1 Tax=Colletotrichum plurivorum TaxID=2175906 RepID=A0A8H6NAU2_9PEZI|nr:trichothecene c-8 hydroxylase cytochrome p450 monooxygenase [Colletotrichum plurivorum]